MRSSTCEHIHLHAVWVIPLSWDYLSWTQQSWVQTMCACRPLCNITALSMSHVYVRKKYMLKHGWGSFVFWWMQICTVIWIKMRRGSTHSHNQAFHRKWLGVLEFCVVVSPFLQFCCDLCHVYYKNIIIIIIITITFLLSLESLFCVQDKLANSRWQLIIVHVTVTMTHKILVPSVEHKIMITTWRF